jgi:hypothetical protein
MASPVILRRVAHVRTDVSVELSASFTRVKRIGELVTANIFLCKPILVTKFVNSILLISYILSDLLQCLFITAASEICRHMGPVRAKISKETVASIFMDEISELGIS